MSFINAIRRGIWECRRQFWMQDERMPHELRNATVLLSEQLLTTATPVPLVGAPDQVYLMPEGDLLVIDSKKRTRPRITEADRLQLSGYRVILANTKDPRVAGRSVRDYGYVRMVTPFGIQYKHVNLFGESVVTAAWNAYQCHKASHRNPGIEVTKPHASDMPTILADAATFFA